MSSLRNPILAKVIELQDGLVSRATGGVFPGEDARYQELRAELTRIPQLSGRLPDFVRNNRDLSQFWEFIKYHVSGYAPRRQFLWESFQPLISALEADQLAPALPTIIGRLEALNADAVEAAGNAKKLPTRSKRKTPGTRENNTHERAEPPNSAQIRLLHRISHSEPALFCQFLISAGDRAPLSSYGRRSRAIEAPMLRNQRR